MGSKEEGRVFLIRIFIAKGQTKKEGPKIFGLSYFVIALGGKELGYSLLIAFSIAKLVCIKGHLISKCPFGAFKSTKNQTKCLPLKKRLKM